MRIVLAALTAMLCSLYSTSAFAEGEVFAVLPTEVTGDVVAEAQVARITMTRALQREALTVAADDDVMGAAREHEATCTQSLIACARLVGAKVHATKVVVSSLWATADSTWELQLTIVDLLSGSEPAPMQRFVTAERREIGAIAEREVLTLIGRGGSGWLSIILQGAARGTLVVDGTVVDALPLHTDKRILAGRRAVEVRVDGHTPWQGQVEVVTGAVTALALRADGQAVVLDEGPAPGPDGLVIGGIVAAGVGVAGIALGVFGDVQQAAARERFLTSRSAADNGDISMWRTVAFASSTTGAVLVGIGVAAIAIGVVAE